jgi:hypothetical protein
MREKINLEKMLSNNDPGMKPDFFSSPLTLAENKLACFSLARFFMLSSLTDNTPL